MLFAMGWDSDSSPDRKTAADAVLMGLLNKWQRFVRFSILFSSVDCVVTDMPHRSILKCSRLSGVRSKSTLGVNYSFAGNIWAYISIIQRKMAKSQKQAFFLTSLGLRRERHRTTLQLNWSQ